MIDRAEWTRGEAINALSSRRGPAQLVGNDQESEVGGAPDAAARRNPHLTFIGKGEWKPNAFQVFVAAPYVDSSNFPHV